MRAFYLFQFLLLTFLFLPNAAQAQTNLTLSTAEIKVDGAQSTDFLIPADLDTLVYPFIILKLEGGDGGKSRRSDDWVGKGGQGAETTVQFALGNGPNSLRPGGILRFVIGGDGENTTNRYTSGGGAGGGGGTGILYLDPSVIHTGGTVPTLDLSNSINYGWALLGVAGGGGGGYTDRERESDGKPGAITENGADGKTHNGSVNAGGTGGSAGVDQDSGSGAGAGYLTTNDVGNNGYNGFAGGIIGRNGDNWAGFHGGAGYGPGGHGRQGYRVGGGGGGGGFSGGGAGRKAGSGGGGGGSFANEASVSTTFKENRVGGNLQDGFVSYYFIEDPTPGTPPIANCVDDIDVIINSRETVTLTPADFDDGSIDPLGFPLTYEMCQTGDGTEYFCRDSKTWDCDDVGRTQPWFLSVYNGYKTSYCAVTIRIIEEEPAPVCPLSGITVVNLDGSCTEMLTGAELAALNDINCSDNIPDVELLLPDGTTADNPVDFFTTGYAFGDGTTTVIYRTEGGQCAFALDVRADAAPFSINCPPDQTINLNVNDCDATVAAAALALGYSGPGSISYRVEPETLEARDEGTGQMPAYTFARGNNSIGYTVVESGGCSAQCFFNVQVNRESTEAIDFACQDVSFPHTSPLDFREAFQAGILRAEDNCGPVPVEVAIGFLTGCNAVGMVQEVQASVGTGSFRQTCSFNLTLTAQDFTPSCPVSPVFIRLGDDFPQTITPQEIANWTDSPEITATTDLDPIDCSDLGRYFVTVTLEDNCGNTDNCIRDVRIVDRTRPVISCQDITRSLDENGESFISYADVLVSVEDNCGIENLSYTLDQTLFTCDDRGSTDIFLSVEDQGGERALCQVSITITDEIAPEINCKDFTVELSDEGTYTLGVADVVATATDNCNVGYTFSQRNFTCADLANSPISVTMTGRDATNNSSSCISLVTVATPECPCLDADDFLVVDSPFDVELCEDLTVAGVRFIQGNLDLVSYELTIVPSSGRIIDESAPARFVAFAGGSLVANMVSGNSGELLSELGLQLSFSDDALFTQVRRSPTTVQIGELRSIIRIIEVVHDFSPPFEDARFRYLESELNNIEEEDLALFVEENGVWTPVLTSSHNTVDNYFEFDFNFNDHDNTLRFAVAPADALLPLDLLSFTGTARDKTNILAWTTVQEEAFSHFEVQRSSDGALWQELGAVAGAGQGTETQSKYTFTDATPLKENYYRLRMVDQDGSFSYSPVVQLSAQAAAASLRVFPNPNAGTFQLALPEVEGDMDLAVYSIHGTCVRARKVVEGTTNVRMDRILPPGFYLVAVTARNGKRWTERVVVR